LQYTLYVNNLQNTYKNTKESLEKSHVSSFREKVNRFVDFKNSPLLQMITQNHQLLRIAQNDFLEIDNVHEQEDQGLLMEVKELKESGVTDKFVKYADRKFILRNDIVQIANDSNEDNKEENLSYIYGKYERFLVDNVTNTNVIDNRAKLALFDLSTQSMLQDRVKEMSEKDFLKEYFPGLEYPEDIPDFQIMYHPLALHIVSNDDDFIQNLKAGKNLGVEEMHDIQKCGGFFTEIKNLKIITESAEITKRGLDTETHELLHAEFALQNPKDNSSKMNRYGLMESVKEKESTEAISKSLGEHMKYLKNSIFEEVCAFFSENNEEGHDFSNDIFDYYAKYYGLNLENLTEELAKKERLTTLNRVGLVNQSQLDVESIRQQAFELKDALKIMHDKGYSKEWILNSFGSMIEPPKFLDKISPKALAMSLTDYNPQKTERQSKLFDKISDKHQIKLNNLKNSIQFPEHFISDLESVISSPDFFTRKGIFGNLRGFKTLIDNLKHGPFNQCVYTVVDENKENTFDFSKILQQYGDNQSTRQAIIFRLDKIVSEAKQKGGIADLN
jgi:hypothetical protein